MSATEMALVLASCFGLSVLSGFVPWISGELIVLSCAALLRSPLSLVAVALAATSGQLAGSSVLYFVGSRVGRLPVASKGRVAEYCSRLRDGRVRALAVVFSSSAVSVPPMCLTTVAAGTSGMRFQRFAAAAGCGLFARYAALAFCPALLRGIL